MSFLFRHVGNLKKMEHIKEMLKVCDVESVNELITKTNIMLKIIGLIVVILVIGAAVYYFGFYKKGKINDRDGDYIPDEIEDAVEDVKEVAKEVKRRAKNVKQELKDVADATKEVLNQAGDVAAAAKGKPRRGRKPKNKI